MKRLYIKLAIVLTPLMVVTTLPATTFLAHLGNASTGITHTISCDHEHFTEESGSTGHDELNDSSECECCDCTLYCYSGHEIVAESAVLKADILFEPRAINVFLSSLTSSNSQVLEHPPKLRSRSSIFVNKVEPGSA